MTFRNVARICYNDSSTYGFIFKKTKRYSWEATAANGH